MGINGEILIIHNISRYCDGIYECVAFNDVPPAVNRVIGVMVECEYCAFHTRNLSGLSNRKTNYTSYASPSVGEAWNSMPFRLLKFFMHDFKTPLIEIKIDIIILNILW